MHRIEIRPVELSEVPTVQRVTALAYEVPYSKTDVTTKPHEPADIEERIRRGEWFVFVAFSGEKIVGAVRCRIRENGEMYLFQLAVLENYRNKGIGSWLVGAVEEFARSKKCISVELDYLKEKKLNKYYERLGYNVVDSRVHKDRVEVCMAKSV